MKDVCKSIQEYGLQASFTINLIQAIGESDVMTPSDWRSILRMILSSAQYTIWASEYKELVIVQVMENISAGLGTGENELLGQDNYATGVADYSNDIRYTLPQHKLLHSLSQIPLQPKKRRVPVPIKGARTVFLNGSRKNT